MKLLIAILLFSITASGQTYITQITTRCCNPTTFQDTTWNKVGNDSIYKRVNGLIVATGIKKTKTFIPYTAVVNTPATMPPATHTHTTLSNYGVDAGTTDSYVITLSSAPAAYTTGMMIIFRANTANTGVASINVNSLGVRNIVKRVSTGLANNDIPAGRICVVLYDGSQFILQNPIVN